MPVSFNWDFEDDPDSSLGPDRDTERSSRRRRWLIRSVILFVLLALGGLAVRTWIDSRLDAVGKVEAELRDIVDVELKSIAAGDRELFRSRQDPDDARWQARQIARYLPLPRGGLTEYAQDFVPAPGLTPAARPTEIKKAFVTGRTGRVDLTHWFQSPISNSLPFHTTWFYRLDDDGVWYHVAPPDDHLGSPYSWHGSRLVIRATEIEVELLDSVASDLASLVVAGCVRLGCPERERYTLSFEGNLSPRIQDSRWTLPPLYLTGLPQNEAARNAWTRALKLWLIEALARSSIDREELLNRAIYRQLVTRLQTELGLTEPVTPDVELLSRALLEGRQHPFSSLWEIAYDPDDPEGNRLLEAEVGALLDWIETQVGSERLYELLPALNDFFLFETALLATYRMAPLDFDAEWLAHLIDLTGVEASDVLALQVDASPLEPPPVQPPPLAPPGDQIAFVCDNRVWMGNADGTDVIPLTPRGEDFESLSWSPDGRWLLTTWVHNQGTSIGLGGEPRALYLLAADGGGGRLLIDDPELVSFPHDWSPDGRRAIYYAGRTTVGESGNMGTWAFNLGSEATRQLPGSPVWSPDKQHLIYGGGPAEGARNVLWLADADWENPRRIVDDFRAWPGGTWSPDSARLALTLDDEETGEPTIFIYDLITEKFTPLVTAADLMVALSDPQGNFVTDGGDPADLENAVLDSAWAVDWSADGSRLLVYIWWHSTRSSTEPEAVLAAVPLDGSAPQVLALGHGMFVGGRWSPVRPDLLTFAWSAQRDGPEPTAYLFDLNAGPLYTATQTWSATWSPDGGWVAFGGMDGVSIVDQTGRPRFALGDGTDCSTAAWNPVADLSALSGPITYTVATTTEDWRFARVRVYQDTLLRVLHVWGQVTNHSGQDQRVIALVPVIRNQHGELVGAQWTLLPENKALLSAVSLDDGSGAPFGLTIRLPSDVRLKDQVEIVLHVAAEPAGSTRDDLDIPSFDADLSGWPDTFQVSGVWENPGPGLSEYLVTVVTVYGVDGRVMGWGWRRETDPASLSGGAHEFEVQVEFPGPVADLGLEIGSYKVQLFGR